MALLDLVFIYLLIFLKFVWYEYPLCKLECIQVYTIEWPTGSYKASLESLEKYNNERFLHLQWGLGSISTLA